MRNILLTLGALLLATAAVIFLVAAWGRLGMPGRAGILIAVTSLCGTAAGIAWRRQLTATAESLGAVTVVLTILDAVAIGAAVAANPPYWPVAFAVSTALCVIANWITPLRAYRTGAALIGQLPLPILVAEYAPQSSLLWAFTLGVQSLGSLGLALAATRRTGWSGVSGPLGVSAAVTWMSAAGIAASDAFTPGNTWDASPTLASLILIGLAGVAVVAAHVWRAHGLLRHVATGSAMVVALAGGYSRLVDVDYEWRSVAGLVLVLAGALAIVRIGPTWKPGPVAVLVVAAGTAGLPSLAHAAYALAAPFTWLGSVWTTHPGASAADVLGAHVGWHDGLATPIALGILTLVVLALAHRTRFETLAALPAVAAGITLPLGVGVPLAAAIAVDLALVAGLVLAWMRFPALGSLLPGCAAAIAAMCFAWSLATPGTTMATAGALLAASLGLAWRHLTPGPVAAAIFFLSVEVVAVARYAGWSLPAVGVALAATGMCAIAVSTLLPSTRAALAAEVSGLGAYVGAVGVSWPHGGDLAASLAIGLAGGTVASVRSRTPLRPVWSGVTAALACAEAVQVATLAGAGDATRYLVLAGAGAVIMPAGTWLVGRLAVELVGALAAAIAVAGISSADLTYLWLALLAAGVGSAVSVLHPHRRSLRAAPTVLLLASSWARLAELGVTAVEAYTVPAAVILVIAGWLRRRGTTTVSSWSAYGPGLTLGLLPSLFTASGDQGTIRPFLLGLAALAVLLVGARHRLQAPVILGGAALAVLAGIQLTPVFLIFYASTPRWIVIGAVGAILLAIGTTFERRARDMRRLRAALRAME